MEYGWYGLNFYCGSPSGSGNVNYTGATLGINPTMSIASTGNIGMGRGAAANRLEVEGNASKSASGSWLANSDRRIKTDIAERIKDAPAEVRTAGEQLTQALATIEEDVYQVKNQSGQDPLNFPIKTNNRLASLLRVAVSGEGKPTGNVDAIFNDLVVELKAETDRLNQTLTTQLPAFNNMLTRIKKDPIKQ